VIATNHPSLALSLKRVKITGEYSSAVLFHRMITVDAISLLGKTKLLPPLTLIPLRIIVPPDLLPAIVISPLCLALCPKKVQTMVEHSFAARFHKTTALDAISLLGKMKVPPLPHPPLSIIGKNPPVLLQHLRVVAGSQLSSDGWSRKV
jgi:hypothetical protein